MNVNTSCQKFWFVIDISDTVFVYLYVYACVIRGYVVTKDFNHGKNAASKRFGVLSDAALKSQADQLHQLSSALSAVRDRVVSLGETHLSIDGVTKFDRGVILLREYLLHVETALLKLNHALGRDERPGTNTDSGTPE